MEIRTLPVGELQTNCYIAFEADKQAVVLDPGDEAARILAAARDEGVTVVHILLTHVHFDHMLAVRELQEATGADLLVPAEDEDALTNGARSLLAYFRPGLRYPLKAERLLRDGDEVRAGSLILRTVHTPGHTPGSACYVGEGVIFSGDTLFAGSYGRTDFPGGDFGALVRSAERLAALPGDYTLYPGHDGSTTLELERRRNPLLNPN